MLMVVTPNLYNAGTSRDQAHCITKPLQNIKLMFTNTSHLAILKHDMKRYHLNRLNFMTTASPRVIAAFGGVFG
jgi:hypothetical protein